MKLSIFLATAPLLASSKLDIPTKQIADGVQMPVVNIGTAFAQTTKPQDRNITAVLGNWLDLGGRGIDGGFFYDTGIAKVLAEYSIPREELFITERVGGYACPGTNGTKQFLDDKLKELNTDYIDLLLMQLKPPGWSSQCADTWRAMEDFVAQGKVKSLGVTNWKPDRFGGFKYKIPPAINQVAFNVYDHDDATEKYCKENKIVLEAWSPLGDPARSTGKSIFNDPTIKAIADNHKVSAAQVALRWIVQKGHTFTFLSSNKEHQANDADVFSFTLDDDEVAKLDTLKNSEKANVVV